MPGEVPVKNLIFRLFWTTHMLYPLFFFLLCIHGLQVFSHMKLATSMLVTDVTGRRNVLMTTLGCCQQHKVVTNITVAVEDYKLIKMTLTSPFSGSFMTFFDSIHNFSMHISICIHNSVTIILIIKFKSF